LLEEAEQALPWEDLMEEAIAGVRRFPVDAE
jgi:hypothetical protein